MRLPFTELDYSRALRKAWPRLSQRQRALVHGLAGMRPTPCFTMEQAAKECGETQPAFVALLGALASAMAEHMGMSVRPTDDSEAWYGILIERSGDSRTLLNVRTPFANSLKNISDLPLP